MIFLDTDVCIELLRGNQRVIQNARLYREKFGLSFMCVAELYYGAQNSAYPTDNKLLVDRFLLTLSVVHTDPEILMKFGDLKSRLKKQETLIPDADLFIASTALVKGQLLVTGNTKHFQRIEGLKIENWIR